MKKVLFWLAGVFNVDLTVEKIIYRDKIVEVPKIVEKEIIKEVEVFKYMPNPDLSDAIRYEGYVEDSLTINGNFLVKGILIVHGEVSCYKKSEYGNN